MLKKIFEKRKSAIINEKNVDQYVEKIIICEKRSEYGTYYLCINWFSYNINCYL